MVNDQETEKGTALQLISDNWFKLSLKHRRQWWHDTDYGDREPSDELVQTLVTALRAKLSTTT